MIQVSPRDVLAIAPEFRTTLSGQDAGSEIAALVGVARSYVPEGRWGAEKGKVALALLTAHLMKELGFGAEGVNHNGMVTSERVGDLSRSYAVSSISGTSVLDQLFMTTQYGRQFIMLRRTLPSTPLVC